MHSEQRRARLVCSQKRSGYSRIQDSHTAHTATANASKERAYTLPMNSMGVNIIRWSQLKIRQVVQHRVRIISRKGHQTSTQIKSHT